jgi:hypothetical protein
MDPKQSSMPEGVKHAGYSREDEYFWERDRELIARLRAEADADRQRMQGTAARQDYWMRCPKCGGKLAEESLEGLVRIDRCLSCGGVFLDKGELEIILKAKPHLLERIVSKG